MPVEAPVKPDIAPTTTPFEPLVPQTPEREEPRPYYDPDTVREPGEICPQQKREQGWEAI